MLENMLMALVMKSEGKTAYSSILCALYHSVLPGKHNRALGCYWMAWFVIKYTILLSIPSLVNTIQMQQASCIAIVLNHMHSYRKGVVSEYEDPLKKEQYQVLNDPM